jgi:putative transposase
MAWNESNKERERLRFVEAVGNGEDSMSALCVYFGISRETGYTWLSRYRRYGLAGLSDRSHAPHEHGRKTADAIVEALLALKRQKPNWGPKKLVARLADVDATVTWPAPSTASEILKRAGLVSSRRHKRRTPPRFEDLTTALRPNHVWAADHKGWVAMKGAKRLEPLTMTDSFSRYVLLLSTSQSTQVDEAMPLFERAFAEYGLPQVIRTDNGVPFASATVTGLTRLGVYLAKLGIHHERIDPGQPQQNGRHERFHRTLNEVMSPPADSLEEQANRFEVFRSEYNHLRPHEALGQKTPSHFYAKSQRPLPDRLPEPDYGREDAVRSVRSNGEIKWNGELIYIASILAGEHVAVQETEDGQWLVKFYNRKLGLIDPEKQRLTPIPKPVNENTKSGTNHD